MSEQIDGEKKLLNEERKWTDPASILCRWKNEPNPCGTSADSGEPISEIIKINKIVDADAYMRKWFGEE